MLSVEKDMGQLDRTGGTFDFSCNIIRNKRKAKLKNNYLLLFHYFCR
jgi:hypothetical protein